MFVGEVEWFLSSFGFGVVAFFVVCLYGRLLAFSLAPFCLMKGECSELLRSMAVLGVEVGSI